MYNLFIYKRPKVESIKLIETESINITIITI